MRAIIFLPFLGALGGLILAALVIVRDHRARANQFLAAGLAVLGLHQIALGALVLAPSSAWLFISIRASVTLAAFVPPLWLAFSLTFAERTGTPSTSWWPAFVALMGTALGGLAILTTGRTISPTYFGTDAQLLVGVDAFGQGFFAAFLVGLTLVLLHVENLYRRADRMTRWRIKFLVVGIFVAFTAQIVVASYVLLYGVFHPWHPILSALAFVAGEALIAISLARCRLLQVDVLLSRYLVCRSLTLLLVGGYLVSLGAFAKLFLWLNISFDLATGILLGSVGAAALALVLLSENVRGRTQRFLHTHCYKHKYDFRLQWMEFTKRLSRATAVPDIAAHTAQQILEVMWVRRVALYKVAPACGQTTLVHQVGYDGLPTTLDLSPTDLEQLQSAARSLADPTSRDCVFAAPPAVAGFSGFPVGMVVPMAALNTLAGILVVGPELSGEPFGIDDRDLLAAVAAQAGAMIVNALLAQEAAEGREFQALARLSAFVAHDLKNSVSMLSMLAENAPQHIHKPAFQADATRTLSEVTAKMRRLLATLSTPNPQTRIGAQRFCLASAVESWSGALAAQIPPRIRLETRLAGVQEIFSEPEKIRSVLANLVLNAIEAISEEGSIHIETEDALDAAVLRVSDTGRGMSPEFIRERLFRPFQTTKPHGLGIGLYQSRHVIHACKGTLTVQSRDGQGTQITIRLPAAAAVDAASPPVLHAGELPARDDLMAVPPVPQQIDLAFNRR